MPFYGVLILVSSLVSILLVANFQQYNFNIVPSLINGYSNLLNLEAFQNIIQLSNSSNMNYYDWISTVQASAVIDHLNLTIFHEAFMITTSNAPSMFEIIK